MTARIGSRGWHGWLVAVALVATMGCAGPKSAQAPAAPAPAPSVPGLAAQAPPAHDHLNATLWIQNSVEFKATAMAAFVLPRIRLDQALADPNWTALIPPARGWGA